MTRDYKEGNARLGDLVFRCIDTSGLEPFMDASSLQAGLLTIWRDPVLCSLFGACISLAGVCCQHVIYVCAGTCHRADRRCAAAL